MKIILIMSLLFIYSTKSIGKKRDLSFLKENKITIGEKTFGKFKDKIFVDSLGREAHFRGWNYSNASKGSPFFPFGNKPENLQSHLTYLRTYTGSNIIRWVMNWEAFNPEVDLIDLTWLRKTTDAFKKAIKMEYFILLDFHQDLFSGHIVGGGNGAPKYIVDGMNVSKKGCRPKILCFSWAINYFLNKGVKQANRRFWTNMLINTKEGKRYVQDEFIWAIKRALSYWRENLTKKEFEYILGVDPYNEPAEGGLKKLKLSPAEFHEQLLWPFYKKIRKMMDSIGYREKPLFSEPVAIWNVNLPLITPRGSGFLKDIPKGNYVFNAHLYDETREGLQILGREIKNGAYLKEMDRFRDEGRYLGQPPFVSEFGAWGNTHIFDANRMMKAVYQSMETTKTSKSKINYIDFYAPLVSGTQWVWPGTGISSIGKWKSFWKSPSFSKVLERAYPRRVQGHIMSFYYNDTATDSYKERPMDWAAIRLKRKYYFQKNKFLWLVWRGNNSSAPTEVFLPRHFNKDNLLIMTENKIIQGLSNAFSEPTGARDEIFYKKDWKLTDAEGGTRLFVYDDKERTSSNKDFHFLLIVEIEKEKAPSRSELNRMQKLLKNKCALKESPIYLMGKVKIDKPKKAAPYKKSIF